MAFQIALDGPAGSGKSTVGKLVASQLNFVYIDTGAMYRAFAFKLIKHHVSLDDDNEINKIMKTTQIELDEKNRVFLDKDNVTALIRTPDVSKAASVISAKKKVRKWLVSLQQIQASKKNVIMDGRDIGTVVLPKANLKVYLDASIQIRVIRRKNELEARGIKFTEKQIKEEIIERDNRDLNREESPLMQASDAIRIETDNYSIEEIVKKIIILVKERM